MKILRPKALLLTAIALGLAYFTLSQVPHPSAASQARLSTLLYPQNNCIAQALFTPQDDLAQTLIDLIENERKSIKIAVYFMTHREIATALIKAKLVNHVDVQIVTDGSHLENSGNCQAWYLQENGINLYIFDPATLTKNNSASTNLTDHPTNLATANITTNPDLTKKRALMHHKFCIFAQNFQDRTLLVTGSFNHTYSAQKDNQENIVIVDIPQLIQKYQQQFDWLKAHAKPLDQYVHENLIGKTQVFGRFAR